MIMKINRTLFATILLLAGFLFSSGLQAQTVSAGTWMLGGEAGFASTKVKDVDDSYNTIYLNPNVGYFIMDNLGVGLRLGFQNNSFGDASSTGFGIGAMARYYVFQGLFPQVGFMYNSFKVKDGPDAATDTDINLGLGYSFFLNNSVALEPQLYYNINSEEANGNTLGLSIGLQIFLGRD
jgi:outer membrane protein